ncbi:nucleoporin nup211-like [Nicotiana sylvestris]|uniref:nucleoporin nup211-like n=1 Tax=Nicotiana sylvestris TaxID=4096 RepID=UPI00388CE4AD
MANQVIIGALFQEGTSQVRPPYFNGQHFSHWKVRMKIFAKAYDIKVWRVIKKGNYPLPASTPPLADPGDIDSYSKEQLEVVQVNNKERNLLHNAISGEEYEKYQKENPLKRCLPTTWQTKVVTLESQDLNKLSYDELRGELIAFERTHLKKTNQEEKKKIVAFKTSTEMAENEIDDPEALQEEIAMMSRNMDGLMRRYRSTKKGRFPPKRSRQYNEQDKNDGKFYECGKFGHIQTECPELKRKISRGFNKNKSFGSWSDEDDSDHEEITNLCFMTILENEMNKTSGCWTNEDVSDDENENCFMAQGETSEVRSYDCERYNELQDIFDSTLKEFQKMMNELKRLTREVKDWKLKHELCEIEKEVLQEEFEDLQMQLNNMRKSTSHSSVRSNQTTYKSTGKEPARTKSTSSNTYERSISGSDVKCHCCNKSGHKYSFCHFRKSNVSGWVWKPKSFEPSNTNPPGPRQAWEALKDSSWVQAMQEELDQFSKNQVWKLIPKPDNVSVIGTKWVFRNKLNEDGKVIRNKARLVAQGYSQQE